MPVRDRTGALALHDDQRIRIALAHTAETNPRYRLLLVMILLHAGPDAHAHPSLRTLAGLVPCALATASLGVEHLRALGELTVTRGRGGPPGLAIPNQYAVSIRCPADCAEPTHVIPAPLGPLTRAKGPSGAQRPTDRTITPAAHLSR